MNQVFSTVLYAYIDVGLVLTCIYGYHGYCVIKVCCYKWKKECFKSKEYISDLQISDSIKFLAIMDDKLLFLLSAVD